jgi:hypothetical protein
MSGAMSSRAAEHRPRSRSHRRVAAAAAVALVFAVVGCGSDDDGDSADATTTTEAAAAEPTAIEATLTDTAIEGVPEELEAGLVDVTVTDETTDEGAGGDLSFSMVEEGTTEDEFKTGLAQVFAGEAFPDFFLNTAGAIGEGMFALEEGSYMVWMDRASNLDRESTAEDLILAPLTVAGGTPDAQLPEADGTVTATDYRFDVDIPAGEATVNFSNDSEKEYHHLLLIGFGTNDPAVIEEHLMEILESEGDSPPPEGVDMSQMDFEAGGTSVFGPGSAGQVSTDLTAGNTYAAVCFISDVAGGAPHAIQHSMTEVFTVS